MTSSPWMTKGWGGEEDGGLGGGIEGDSFASCPN